MSVSGAVQRRVVPRTSPEGADGVQGGDREANALDAVMRALEAEMRALEAGRRAPPPAAASQPTKKEHITRCGSTRWFSRASQATRATSGLAPSATRDRSIPVMRMRRVVAVGTSEMGAGDGEVEPGAVDPLGVRWGALIRQGQNGKA